MPRFQAFISDMDDTLLPAHKPMSERTQRTLQRLSRQGVSVVLCSGRAGASIWPFVRQTGATGEMICFNGARVVDLKNGEVLVQNEIAPELAREMLAWLKARGCYAHYFQGDQWYCEEECAEASAYAAKSGIPAKYTHRPLAACVNEPAPKLLGIGDPETIARLREEGQKAFAGRLNVMTSSPNFLEITAPEANKGCAIEKLCAVRGWSKETVLCAGDGLNDLSMMEWAKYAITVENAKPEVKAVSWRIGKACEQDGIAELLDEIIPAEAAE